MTTRRLGSDVGFKVESVNPRSTESFQVKTPGCGFKIISGVTPGFRLLVRSRAGGGYEQEYPDVLHDGLLFPCQFDELFFDFSNVSASQRRTLLRVMIYTNDRFVLSAGNDLQPGRKLRRFICTANPDAIADGQVKTIYDDGTSGFGDLEEISGYNLHWHYATGFDLAGWIHADVDFAVRCFAYIDAATPGTAREVWGGRARQLTQSTVAGGGTVYTWTPEDGSTIFYGTNAGNSLLNGPYRWPVSGGYLEIENLDNLVTGNFYYRFALEGAGY